MAWHIRQALARRAGLPQTVHVFALPTVALPSVVPPEVTVISEPTVPWPVSRKPSALMARADGVATSVPVGPVTGTPVDSLPAGSMTTTATVALTDRNRVSQIRR